MNCLYDDFPWHDSIIEEIRLDRRDAGYSDTLELLIRDPDGKLWKVVFSDLRSIDARMNFGIIATESIFYVELLESSVRIEEIKNDWKSMGITLSELKCYKIITNSTGSLVEIYASNILIDAL